MLPPDETTPPEETQPTEGEAPLEETTETEVPTPEDGQEAKPAEEAETAAEEKPEGEEDSDEETTDGEGKPAAKGRRNGSARVARKAEWLARENELLRQQLEATRQAAQPAPTAPAKEKSPDEKVAELIRGVARAEWEELERKREAQAQVSEFQKRWAQERAKHEDFDEVVRGADIPTNSPLGQSLLTSEHGPAILYALASDPAELARISALAPFAAAREIGRLEAKLASVAVPVKPKPALRLPAPKTTVAGSKPSTRSLESLPMSDYKRAFRSGRR